MEDELVVFGIIEFEDKLVEEGVEMSSSLDQVEDLEVGDMGNERVFLEEEQAAPFRWSSECWGEEVLVLEDEVGSDRGAGVVEDIEEPFAELIRTSFGVFGSLKSFFGEEVQNSFLEFQLDKISNYSD